MAYRLLDNSGQHVRLRRLASSTRTRTPMETRRVRAALALVEQARDMERPERNIYIRLAIANGCLYREVAEAIGLTLQRVHQIVHEENK
jgi:hypothetical protein